MALTDAIAHIDSKISELKTQIAGLEQAKALLGGSVSVAPAVKKSGRGRPKGSKNAAKAAETKPVEAKPAKKRQLSEEGRKAIAEAMKRRWAERRTAAAS